MPGSSGPSISSLSSSSSSRGENRFYCPPALRRLQQQQQRKQRSSDDNHRGRADGEFFQNGHLKPVPRKSVASKKEVVALVVAAAIGADGGARAEGGLMEKSVVESENCLVSASVSVTKSNLDRFLESTTPRVPFQFLPKTSMDGWRTCGVDCHPYFVLEDLWESFKQWSAYGAGVPLLLNGSDPVIQYYVPYLSGIQLYVDPSKPYHRKSRRPGEESDSESSRETSSDGSTECTMVTGVNGSMQRNRNYINVENVAVFQNFNGLSVKDNSPSDSSCDEAEVSNPAGHLIFEYLERDQPYSREPLADKIAALASKFPDLKTCRSCDLTSYSWISVAWYPIYRIPTGPTLQNLDACFLTFHFLSTSALSKPADVLQSHKSTTRGIYGGDTSPKLPLPIFGLASYKFKISVWNPSGVEECPKASSLLRAADDWLQLLQVNHPDFIFFVSHSSSWR
ncbi:hypothetical protein MLD38_016366 [Melastoma candidum]|uniref:Uncharacterized protein n=1 Tax=Melastoma candidum TaxID=119954 RepID=A0ACB9RSN9_9MYRT|nr:hypothetical protein MLD38_016366 [Melastoma candidum]